MHYQSSDPNHKSFSAKNSFLFYRSSKWERRTRDNGLWNPTKFDATGKQKRILRGGKSGVTSQERTAQRRIAKA